MKNLMIEIETCAWKDHFYYDGESGFSYPLIHAHIKDDTSIWASGETTEEAIANLISKYPSKFNISLSHIGPQPIEINH